MSVPYLVGNYHSVQLQEVEYRVWTIPNYLAKLKIKIKIKKEEIEVLKRIVNSVDLNQVQREYWKEQLVKARQILKRFEKQASILLA